MTAIQLGLAGEDIDASLCACGCGFPADVAHDPTIKDRVVVEPVTCYIRQAITEVAEHDKDAHVYRTRLLAPGETREDVERADYEELKARIASLSSGVTGPDREDHSGDQDREPHDADERDGRGEPHDPQERTTRDGE